MSENLDLVRSICQAWERGDYRSVAWQHPEIEFVIVDGPAPGRWAGAEGIARGWGGFLSSFGGFYTRIDEYRALDEEHVPVLARFGGREKTSGVEVGQTSGGSAGLFGIREGGATRLVLYFDRDRAFGDVGLKE